MPESYSFLDNNYVFYSTAEAMTWWFIPFCWVYLYLNCQVSWMAWHCLSWVIFLYFQSKFMYLLKDNLLKTSQKKPSLCVGYKLSCILKLLHHFIHVAVKSQLFMSVQNDLYGRMFHWFEYIEQVTTSDRCLCKIPLCLTDHSSSAVKHNPPKRHLWPSWCIYLQLQRAAE